MKLITSIFIVAFIIKTNADQTKQCATIDISFPIITRSSELDPSARHPSRCPPQLAGSTPSDTSHTSPTHTHTHTAMFRTLRYRMDGTEPVGRRIRRALDTLLPNGLRGSRRRALAAVLVVVVLLLYVGPALLRSLFGGSEPAAGSAAQTRCLDERLAPFRFAERQFNAHIRRYGAASGGGVGDDGSGTADGRPTTPTEKQLLQQGRFVPYVGNGLFGLEVEPGAHIMIKSGRALSLPVYFHPIVSVVMAGGAAAVAAGAAAATSEAAPGAGQSASVVDYVNGVVHRFQCFDEGVDVSAEYYAHRRMPNVFVQELLINNPRNQLVDVELTPTRISNWPTAITQVIK